MQAILSGNWIGASLEAMDAAPLFFKDFSCLSVRRATLYITSLGVYEAFLNGERVGDFIMAPGWTDYDSRLQVQTYDVTGLIKAQNQLRVGLGKGWYASRLGWLAQQSGGRPVALLAVVRIEKEDGSFLDIPTDDSWTWCPSDVRFSDLYDGETVDARVELTKRQPVLVRALPKDNLICQEGETVTEQETLRPIAAFTTPKGEQVIDFGQNLTGYVSFEVSGREGQEVQIHHAEVLDRDGNFYTDNLRTAKAAFTAVLKQGANHFKPRYTFYGFRYIRLINWPEAIDPNNFRAIAVNSSLKRTGQFECGSELVNKLYQNILWGQKDNFLDVPTDCPQRDERLGWTGDAQVFIRTAAYNYDVKRFFTKWLHDLKADQHADGGVTAFVPDVEKHSPRAARGLVSAAWGDAACVCPWQLYVSYGDATILAEQYESMRQWVEYMRAHGSSEYLWDDGAHYGDWLGLDAPYGSYKGSTDENLIACAFFAHSTSLLIRAGQVLNKDVAQYETLYKGIVDAFQKNHMPGGVLTCQTQTAHVLALHFGLCEDPDAVAASLAELVRSSGHLTTGFVGTPYLLHALSDHGYTELAYDLLLREAFPSWIFSVKQGATTIWEHWDSIREDGSMWPVDMNSFNHYAYGSVGDWLYGVAAGIKPVESAPAYQAVRICPKPDPRLGFVRASLETPHGRIESAWRYEDGNAVHEISIPDGVEAEVVIGGQSRRLGSGRYTL